MAQAILNRRILLGRAPLVLPAMLLLLAFFVLPLLDNGMRSITDEHGAGFTLARYGRMSSLLHLVYLRSIAYTLSLSGVVTFICILVGYPVAYYLVRYAGRCSSLVVFLLIAPLLTSIIMRTSGWQVLFARRGLINTLLVKDFGLLDQPLKILDTPGIVVAALVHVLVPFMVLSIASVLQGVDRRLEESAQLLGAGRLRTFFEVTLPLSLDGIGTGSILVFMIANGSFVTLVLLGGGLQTLPLLIYEQFNTTRDFAMASTMSTVLLVVALVCLFLQLRMVRRGGADEARLARIDTRVRARLPVSHGLVCLFFLFMTLPIAIVVVASFTDASFVAFPIDKWSLRWFRRVFEYQPYLESARVSFEIAFGATAISAKALGSDASGLACSTSAWASAAMTYLLSPLSMPMIVIGFAALFFLSRIGIGVSFTALLIAHSTVCLPCDGTDGHAVLYRGTDSEGLEEAAALLGANPLQVFWHVILPLIRPGVVAGSLFSFLVSFDNLPISYFFGSPDTLTLPVVMLSYMEHQFDPSIAALSTLQLLFALICLVVVDRLRRGIENTSRQGELPWPCIGHETHRPGWTRVGTSSRLSG